jgi:hypothetical protein
MAMPDVGQAKMLANEFEGLLETYAPTSAALTGCAGAIALKTLPGTEEDRASNRPKSPTRFHEAAFFRRSAHQDGIAERKAMIDREHDLSITKQAEILKVSRGSVYICRGRFLPPTSRSCGSSIGCAWSISQGKERD